VAGGIAHTGRCAEAGLSRSSRNREPTLEKAPFAAHDGIGWSAEIGAPDADRPGIDHTRLEETMNVKSILESKGRQVHTIGPNETLVVAIKHLTDRKIGALVVTEGDRKIVGILSERDIVRVLAKHGTSALDQQVRQAMTAKVKICNETHTINQVMEIMTQGRFRHLPIEKNGQLDGIISIGDVVKKRIEEVEREAEEIKQYIATA
jgi:CBS domain-containing protein